MTQDDETTSGGSAAPAAGPGGGLPVRAPQASIARLAAEAAELERGPPLAPISTTEALERTAAELDELAQAPNTKSAYSHDWNSFLEFCRDKKRQPLPADPETVRLYLVQLVTVGGRKGKPLKVKTAERHISAIADAHRVSHLPFDSRAPAIARVLQGMRRAYGTRRRGARALEIGHIRAIANRLGALDKTSIRNKAIILLGFAASLRRSEITALNVEDVEFVDIEIPLEQPGATLIVPEAKAMKIFVARGKGDQAGEGRVIGIMPGRNPATCPVRAMRMWIEVAQIEHEKSEALFRPITWGVVEARRLSDGSRNPKVAGAAVDRIVKQACALAGIDGKFSAHSLRVGHVTAAKAAKVDNRQVRRQTGHASDAMIEVYDRNENVFIDNSSASLGL